MMLRVIRYCRAQEMDGSSWKSLFVLVVTSLIVSELHTRFHSNARVWRCVVGLPIRVSITRPLRPYQRAGPVFYYYVLALHRIIILPVIGGCLLFMSYARLVPIMMRLFTVGHLFFRVA